MQMKVVYTKDDPRPEQLPPEEVKRQAQERHLEWRRKVRLTAPRLYGPAVHGVLWRTIRPGDAETAPGPPILSILEFALRRDVELLGDAAAGAAAPAQALWDATVEYVVSVPGCEGMEWGTTTTAGMGGGDEGPARRAVCWVRWESVAAWRGFQWSMGFWPVIRALAVGCSNRCAKVAEELVCCMACVWRA